MRGNNYKHKLYGKIYGSEKMLDLIVFLCNNGINPNKLDLHGNNFMKRSDGTIVLIDPAA